MTDRQADALLVLLLTACLLVGHYVGRWTAERECARQMEGNRVPGR